MASFIRFIAGRIIQSYRRHQMRQWILSKFPSAVIEDNVHLKGKLDNLSLGDGVILQFGTVVHLGGMDWCENAGSLSIGDGGVISPNCVLYACGPGGISIGRNFDCGPGVGIFASRTDYLRGVGHHHFAAVDIGDDVTIFANAVISPGVNVGNGAVIAAGSVVTSDVPVNTLAGGVPARSIRENLRSAGPTHDG